MDEKSICHFCKEEKTCLDGGNLFGFEEIEAVCFECVKNGKLMDLDISCNDIDSSTLSPEVVNEIVYCTPSLPTWQDCSWPVKNGTPGTFIKIASKLDYDSKEQFVNSLYDCEKDPDLWEMLPGIKITNMKEGQYDISFYLFEVNGEKLTIWDAN